MYDFLSSTFFSFIELVGYIEKLPNGFDGLDDKAKTLVMSLIDAVSAQKELDETLKSSSETLNKDLVRLGEKTRLMQAEAQFGKDSLGYLSEAHQLELDKLQSQVKSGAISQEVADLMSEQLRIQHQITLSMEHMSGIGIKNPFTDAIPEALNLRDIMYEMAVISSKIGRGGDTGMTTGSMDWFDNSNPLFYGDLLPPKLPEDKTRGAGGGGSKTSAQESPLKKLQAQLKLEQELIGKSEEYARVRQALGESYDRVEPKQIANLENQIRLIEEAKQAEQDRLSIMGTVESSMEEGFMSMIDGTASVKDAFKEMARQIIAELMRILVVKRMVSGITTALGFADGGAFSGGSQVQAYADGGVVGGPTFFPMSGGKTGLMGEAGPEAIMPLKRGANGKLGVQMEGSSGGAINIVQNFSFAANGDESVKKLIAQAAPQIAQMTQKQIIDSRRRGGAMKSTFG